MVRKYRQATVINRLKTKIIPSFYFGKNGFKMNHMIYKKKYVNKGVLSSALFSMRGLEVRVYKKFKKVSLVVTR